MRIEFVYTFGGLQPVIIGTPRIGIMTKPMSCRRDGLPFNDRNSSLMGKFSVFILEIHVRSKTGIVIMNLTQHLGRSPFDHFFVRLPYQVDVEYRRLARPYHFRFERNATQWGRDDDMFVTIVQTVGCKCVGLYLKKRKDMVIFVLPSAMCSKTITSPIPISKRHNRESAAQTIQFQKKQTQIRENKCFAAVVI